MILRDRKKLATLMVINNLTQRALAKDIGWSSHSYLGRLLRGQVKTLEPGPALRIANRLGVGVDDLFLPGVSSISGHAVTEKKTA